MGRRTKGIRLAKGAKADGAVAPAESNAGSGAAPRAVPDTGGRISATASSSMPPAFAFFNEIGIIEQLSRNAFERVIPADLTLSQFSVLNHFARRGGEESPLQLANAFQVSKATMTNTLQKLHTKGLIAVRPDPDDGRAKLVSLTASGQAMRDQAIAALIPEMARLDAEFSTADFEQALPFLVRLRSFLDAARDL